jgi:hypothetical protein
MSRFVIVATSVAITVAVATLAFWLGAWAFGYRRYSTHQTRLQHLVVQRPTLARVVQGLHDEGSPLVASPVSDEDLQRVAAERGRGKAAEVLEKGRRWPRTRVFVAGDMVYFIYFDDADVMRDFTCVGK